MFSKRFGFESKIFWFKIKGTCNTANKTWQNEIIYFLEKVTITKRANKIFIQNTHLLYKQKVILEILASQYYKQKILYFENIKQETYKLLLMFIKAMIKDDEQLNKAVDYLLEIEKRMEISIGFLKQIILYSLFRFYFYKWK